MVVEIHEVFSGLIFRPISLQKAMSNKITLSVAAPYGRRHYSGADKYLARPTSRCIFFDGENIFLMLVLLYIYIHIYIVLIFLQL
jgi:hypothetical protein